MRPISRHDEMLRHQYEQVCNSYRAIDDFRGKLLALWPILGGGAAGVALLTSKNTNTSYLGAVSIFGFFISVGIAVYEWNQTLRCDLLKQVGRKLEEQLKLEVGQFKLLPSGFAPRGSTPPLSELKRIVEEEEEVRSEKARARTREADAGASGPHPSIPKHLLRSLQNYAKKPIAVGVASSLVYIFVILGWFWLSIWAVFLN
jgi:hypothetical protein